MTSKDIANNMGVSVFAARGLVAFLEECGAMTKIGTKRNNIKSRGKPANDYTVNMESVNNLFGRATSSLVETAALPKQVLPPKAPRMTLNDVVAAVNTSTVTPPSTNPAPSWASVDGVPIDSSDEEDNFESEDEDGMDLDGEEDSDALSALEDISPSSEDLNNIEEEEESNVKRPAFERDGF